MDKELLRQLGLSSQDYQEWKNFEPNAREENFPVWALNQFKITEDNYAKWAVKKYKLSFLKKSFLYDMSISIHLWNTVKNFHQWNQFYLPVYQWNDLTYAICVTPSSEKHNKSNKKNIITLLTSPKTLELFWKQIQRYTHSQSVQQTENKAKDQVNIHKNPAIKTTRFIEKPITLIKTIIDPTLMKKINSSHKETNLFKIFDISKKFFLGVIVFTFDNNESFTPLEWSDSLSGPATPVYINKPSIFKIIHRTKEPYHGPIPENPIHKDFFYNWGFKNIPKHITLIPIVQNNIIEGAFMGIADKLVPNNYLIEIQSWTKNMKALADLKQQTKAG